MGAKKKSSSLSSSSDNNNNKDDNNNDEDSSYTDEKDDNNNMNNNNSSTNLDNIVIQELKSLYTNKLLPIEKKYLFHNFNSPEILDSELSAKPTVLLIGQYSTGKTSFIRHLIGNYIMNSIYLMMFIISLHTYYYNYDLSRNYVYCSSQLSWS